jgi:hypothetical protein
MIGFSILAIGVLLYNEIVVLPILGFNNYTREALEKKHLHLVTR